MARLPQQKCRNVCRVAGDERALRLAKSSPRTRGSRRHSAERVDVCTNSALFVGELR